MAVTSVNTLSALLTTLTQYLSSAATSVPESATLQPPPDGISLFDTKNELFLAYLQNLVFLILLKIRNQSRHATLEPELDAQVVKKLVEIRVYLERGVRKLETDLSYQINKVLQAADDAARTKAVNAKPLQRTGQRRSAAAGDEDEDSASDDESDTGNDSDNQIQDLQYRPNPAAFARPTSTSRAEHGVSKSTSSDGVYRPPRITATAMALPSASLEEKRKREARRATKSATLDEYISTEYSTAPSTEKSIGSGILRHGRGMLGEQERRREQERREYEEGNFVRLPGQTKKEKRELRRKEGAMGRDRMAYGGEEWTGLGEGVDRIDRLTKKRREGGAGGAARELLERSRKRKAGESDGGGGQIGQGFEKKLKNLDRGRRDRGSRK